MLRSIVLSLVAVLVACATTSRAQYGDIRLRPYGDPGAVPNAFSVEQGRIVSAALDVVQAPDGCLRGRVAQAPLELCAAKGTPPPPEKAGDKVEQWAGPSGNFT